MIKGITSGITKGIVQGITGQNAAYSPSAYRFNEGTDDVNFQNSLAPSTNVSRTAGFVVLKVNALGSSVSSVCNVFVARTGPQFEKALGLLIDSQGRVTNRFRLRAYWQDGSDQNSQTVTVSENLDTGVWLPIHVNFSATAVEVWVNGFKLLNQTSFTQTPVPQDGLTSYVTQGNTTGPAFDVAGLYYNTDDNLEWTTENRSKIFTDGKLVNIGLNGSLVTGNSPTIFLNGSFSGTVTNCNEGTLNNLSGNKLEQVDGPNA